MIEKSPHICLHEDILEFEQYAEVANDANLLDLNDMNDVENVSMYLVQQTRLQSASDILVI